MSSDHLQITPTLAIPRSDVRIDVARSSGPGGQHANVTESRVTATLRFADCASLSDAQRAALEARFGPQVGASAQDTRSQARNRELALERLAERIATALRPQRPRRPTRPSRSARTRRLQAKRQRGETKQARRRPDPDS